MRKDRAPDSCFSLVVLHILELISVLTSTCPLMSNSLHEVQSDNQLKVSRRVSWSGSLTRSSYNPVGPVMDINVGQLYLFEPRPEVTDRLWLVILR